MLEVIFASDKEVMTFCEQLFQYAKHIELHWKTSKEWGNQLQIDDHVLNAKMFDCISLAMADVYVIHRQPQMIGKIIKNYYYYTNEAEIDHILGLTQWIFAGDDDDSRQIRAAKDPMALLRSLFMANMSQVTTIHYDSIVKFRLQPFHNLLVQYVGLAIDEHKREEEHQAFIHMLREYIANKKIKCDTIHMLQGKDFSFFNENGKRLPKSVLTQHMKNEPLYIIGLHEHEMNLAPLIALAPRKIQIYGEYPSEPRTLTIMNVFEERVTFNSLQQFPFPKYSNH